MKAKFVTEKAELNKKLEEAVWLENELKAKFAAERSQWTKDKLELTKETEKHKNEALTSSDEIRKLLKNLKEVKDERTVSEANLKL